ncbi:hypothetical protein JW935_17620 [candidate division KSB1 bacterium]|nr:hypothetical protein [candidate division KSB1 bacterium]
MSRTLLVVFTVLMVAGFGFTQDAGDDVHLFQGFMRDATITTAPYGEAGLDYSSYEYVSTMGIGVQGGMAVMPELEVNAALSFLNWSPDEGDGESGISDILVSGRYLVVPGPTKIAAGGFVTLPVGDEKIGQGNLNFGAFGAVRHALEGGMIIVGTLGLDFMETTKYEGGGLIYENGIPVGVKEPEEKTEYENAFVIGGGVIYPQSDKLNIIGELHLKTEYDYMMLSGGVDYKLQGSGRVRGALGIGLDDGAPDFRLMISYLMGF